MGMWLCQQSGGCETESARPIFVQAQFLMREIQWRVCLRVHDGDAHWKLLDLSLWTLDGVELMLHGGRVCLWDMGSAMSLLEK